MEQTLRSALNLQLTSEAINLLDICQDSLDAGRVVTQSQAFAYKGRHENMDTLPCPEGFRNYDPHPLFSRS
jgi:hypothetical protein